MASPVPENSCQLRTTPEADLSVDAAKRTHANARAIKLFSIWTAPHSIKRDVKIRDVAVKIYTPPQIGWPDCYKYESKAR